MARAGSFEFTPRHLILPIGLVLAVVLRWRFGWGKGSTFLVALFFVALSFVLGPLLARTKVAFDRALMRTLQRGQRSALWPLYRRQWLLRVFAGRRYLAAKRGVIHTELGEHRAATDAFRQALKDAPEREQLLLETYLANALHALGEYEEAERRYRRLLADGVDNPQIYHHLAHAILRRGGRASEARKLLEKGLETAGGGSVALPLRITLAEAWVALGKADRAREALSKANAEAGPLAARRALVEGKVEAAGGDEDAARRCFTRARELDPDGPTGKEAAELLGDAA